VEDAMEFICTDPEAMVRAANVRSTLDAFKVQEGYAQRLLLPFDLKLEDMRPDHFIPVQRWLNAMKHLQQELGPFVLRQVGAAIIENADFPPQLDSVEVVLDSLDQVYHLNHRGKVGHYRTQRRNEAVEVECATPYPRQFERGLIEGIARHTRLSKGRRYMVRYQEGPPNSDVSCKLTVVPVLA
jgi:hypothetical protein